MISNTSGNAPKEVFDESNFCFLEVPTQFYEKDQQFDF